MFSYINGVGPAVYRTINKQIFIKNYQHGKHRKHLEQQCKFCKTQLVESLNVFCSSRKCLLGAVEVMFSELETMALAQVWQR